MPRLLVVGLLKARNEVCREGNIRRCLENMIQFCDTIVACNDASTDGTELILEAFFDEHKIPRSQLLYVPASEQDFRRELRVKSQMLHMIHKLEPRWIWWQDADEVVEDPKKLLALILNDTIDPEVEDKPRKRPGAYRFRYVQLWRSASYARIDDGFADGAFVKLWRWRSDLEFDVVDRTHHMQFPRNVGEIAEAPEDLRVIHFGNYGKNLQWKIHQYHGGLGGIERHRDFEHASYKRLEYDYSRFPLLDDARDPIPISFAAREKTLINAMGALRGLPGWFTVVVPAYNRASYLPEALSSLGRQTYQKWIALVLDDGSTDETPAVMRHWQELDPRIFYARHDRRGAVAMNEIGMRFACDATEWWTRLGSDDYFEPDKLYNDAVALHYGSWCYGPYRVLRADERNECSPSWRLDESCNLPENDRIVVDDLLAGKFRISWANIAARTDLLRKIRVNYGCFCDPQLRNMEDFLVNTRLARLAAPIFRAKIIGSEEILVAHNEKAMLHAIASRHLCQHDAVWRVNPVGASSDGGTTQLDHELTLRLIQEEAEP